MRARRWTTLLATTSALLFSFIRPAAAAASARLVYVRGPGAEGCPGEAAVRAAVRARLGYDPFFAWARDTLYTDIERDGGAFRAVVKLVDDENRQRGARALTVHGTDCTPVIDALGLTVSLTLDPSSLVGERPASATASPSEPPGVPVAPESVTAPAPPPPAETPRAAEAPRVLPASGRDGPAFHAGVGLIAAAGSALSATAGATVSVGASWRRLSLDLEWRGDFPAGGSGSAPPTEVRSWLIVGSVVPCVHVSFAFACPVLSAGAIGATAVAAHATEAYGPWAALGGRLGAAWEIAPQLTLGAYAEALATLLLDSVNVDRTVQYTLSPWTGDLGARASWRFR